MALDTLEFNWPDKTIHVGIDRRGQGPTILMLPALSSISTRSEVRPLGEKLASILTPIGHSYVGETNGHMAAGPRGWLPALPCCRTSWHCGAALPRRANLVCRRR